MTVLNKIHIFDKGYIVLLASSPSKIGMDAIASSYCASNPEAIQQIANATFIFKCPVVVRLALARTGMLQVVNSTKTMIENVTVTSPMIDVKTLEDADRMKDFINSTFDSLVVSARNLQQDNCPPDIAQLLMPLSVYNEVMVHGTLQQWLSFLNHDSGSSIVAAYQSKVREQLKAEWPNLKVWRDGKEKRSK